MSAPVLPFLLPGFVVHSVRTIEQTLLVEAQSVTTHASCPRCQQPSMRVHSRYLRSARDLPVSEQSIRLLLQVRRFFCDHLACTQRTFAERLPDLLPVRAQRTLRLTRTLRVVANALGGMGGARLADKLRMRVSHDTLVRLIRHTETARLTNPRVLGVDDFALQKGRTYGTILVDLEQHQPIDLLPDRTAKTFAAWLRDHPGVEIIARDRSTEYARGASDGAPTACQVADRWHILKNHREALERMLNRLHPVLASCAESTTPTMTLTHASLQTRALRPPSLREQADRQATRDRRMERYQAVQRLYQQGLSILQIASRLHMSRVTVRAFATADRFPERRVQLPQPRFLDPYVPYLQQRWAEGCTNASQLWREIQAHGYPGVRKQVARWAQQHRVAPAPTEPKKYQGGMVRDRLVVAGQTNAAAVSARQPLLAAPRRLVWLLLRNPSALDDDEAAIFSQLQQHSEVRHAHELAQTFQLMIRQRTPDALDGWLAACAKSGIPELQSFAKGLEQDYTSIRAALSEPWSSGQVEGQVTRLKLIKRQMYGRATFDLLKQRVLKRE